MRVEVTHRSNKKERPFPKLMRQRGGVGIALFTCATAATILKSPLGGSPAGWSAQGFVPACWEDFEGSITLSND